MIIYDIKYSVISGCVSWDMSTEKSGQIWNDFLGIQFMVQISFERLPKPRWFVFYSVFPFRHFFREPFAVKGFPFAASVCLKSTFASFRGTSWTKSPCVPWQKHTEAFLPSCQVKGIAGPQPRVLDLSGHCRTPTATARSQWALPLPYQISGEGAIPASHGFRGSFADLSRSFRGFLGHISWNLWMMLSYGSRYIQGNCLNRLEPGFWALKVSFASFRGSKSLQKLARIFPLKSPLKGFGGCSFCQSGSH